MSEPLDLEVIKALEAGASPGPWEAKAYRVYVGDRSMGDRIVAACWRPWGPVTGSGSIEADAEFIAHAREDVPALLEAVERLRDMVVDAQTEAEMQAAEVKRLQAVNGELVRHLQLAAEIAANMEHERAMLAAEVERLRDAMAELIATLNSASGGPSVRDVADAYFAGRDGL